MFGKDNTRTNVSKKQKSGPSRGLRLFVWAIDLFMLILVAIAIYVVIVFLQMPSLDAILHETRPAAVVFLDNNGNEIRASNRIMGVPVSVETLPPHVWQAIIAIEDKRFFEHGPVEFRAIARAMISILVGKSFYQKPGFGFIYEQGVIGWWHAWN